MSDRENPDRALYFMEIRFKSQHSSMLRASIIKMQRIQIFKTEALKYPTAAQNLGHHPEITITWNKNRKTRQTFFLVFVNVELKKSPQPRPEIPRDIVMFTVGLRAQACISVRTSSTLTAILLSSGERGKRSGRDEDFFLFPPLYLFHLMNTTRHNTT